MTLSVCPVTCEACWLARNHATCETSSEVGARPEGNRRNAFEKRSFSKPSWLNIRSHVGVSDVKVSATVFTRIDQRDSSLASTL